MAPKHLNVREAADLLLLCCCQHKHTHSLLVFDCPRLPQKKLCSRQDRFAQGALGIMEPALMCLDITHLEGFQVSQLAAELVSAFQEPAILGFRCLCAS